MADALGMIKQPKHKKLTSLLQSRRSTVDPDDPDYKYHSGEIVKLLQDLTEEFKKKKAAVDADWERTNKGCNEKKEELDNELSQNSESMQQVGQDIDGKESDIASLKEEIVEEEG